MRRKQVWRYYCEYCGKGGCSASHMQKHEDHCISNPNRECGMCGCGPENQAKLRELIPLLPPEHELYWGEGWSCEEEEAITESLNAALPAIREAVANCPLCILAALKQTDVPAHFATDFDYQRERLEWWRIVNDEAARREWNMCGGAY